MSREPKAGTNNEQQGSACSHSWHAPWALRSPVTSRRYQSPVSHQPPVTSHCATSNQQPVTISTFTTLVRGRSSAGPRPFGGNAARTSRGAFRASRRADVHPLNWSGDPGRSPADATRSPRVCSNCVGHCTRRLPPDEGLRCHHVATCDTDTGSGGSQRSCRARLWTWRRCGSTNRRRRCGLDARKLPLLRVPAT
jgi:hypothetical protein